MPVAGLLRRIGGGPRFGPRVRDHESRTGAYLCSTAVAQRGGWQVCGCGAVAAEPGCCDAGARGSHVSFAHPQAYAICQALIDRGVIGDFRAPDVLRLGFAPLYVGFADLWRAVAVLAELLRDGSWDTPRYHARNAVT